MTMGPRIKVVADEAIPFLPEVLEPWAEVVYKPSKGISSVDVRDADALLVRAETKCGPDILEGSTVKLVATTSSGFEHIDLGYCDSKGILVRNSSGCNTVAVMNYVFSALYGVSSRKSIKLAGEKLGIVGVGSIGRLVDQVASLLSFKVLKNDPPRMAKEGNDGFCSLDYLLESSQIVILCVPSNPSTHRMADDSFFARMKPGTIFMNVSRGDVVDEEALKRAIPRLGPVILDTWDNEPDVDRELVEMVDLATPHIAGYSYQSVRNCTAAAVRSVARYFGIEGLYDFYPRQESMQTNSIRLDLKRKSQGQITSVLQYNYPVFSDDFLFRMQPERFEELRSNYRFRREFHID